MATRPTVGGSDGTWGTELNAHLDVSLDADGKVDDGASQTTSAAPGADAELANKKYIDDHVGHDGDGYILRDVDGTPTKVYTKYLTGTLDADASTSVAHGITGIDNILACGVAVYQDTGTGVYSIGYQISDHYSNATPATARCVFSYDGTNVTIATVGSLIQGNKYRIKLDYIA